MAQLDDDSAITLYRAARAADPSYIIAQFEYMRFMQFRLRSADLHRDYATTDSTSALKLCLMAASGHANESLAARTHLLAIEGRFGPTECTDAFLVGIGNTTPERSARAVRNNPNIGELWGILIAVLKQKGDWGAVDQAAAAALRAIDDPTERTKLSLHRISWRLERHDTTGALALWNEIARAVEVDGRPGPMAEYLSARCINREHPDPRSTEATRAEYCRRFFALVRTRRAPFTEYVTTRTLGQIRLDRGELDVAIPLSTRLTTLADAIGTPGLQVEAYTQRSRAYAKAGQLAPALRDAQRAVALAPATETPYYQADAWHNLAHAYEGMGRFVEAAAAADTFAVTADINPDATARWMSRHDAGDIRRKAGWHAAAMRDYDTMKRIVDEMGNNGHYFVGEYLERRGDLGQALEYYRTGARLEGGDPRALSAMVRMYETLGFVDSAETVARRHDAESDRWPITERPMLPDLLAARGRVREAVDLAGTWARRVTKGGNVEGAAIAQIRFAELLLLHHDARSALVAATTADSLSRLLNLTTHTINARTLMGRAMMDQGQRAAGLAALQEAVKLANAHPSTEALRATNLALADALIAYGRRDDALAAFDRAGAAVERMTAGLNEDTYRTGYKALQMAPFDGALRALLNGKGSTDAAAALDWSVRRKAAALTLAGAPGLATRRVSVEALRNRLAADEALIDFSVLDSSVTAIVVRRDAIVRVALATPATQLAAWTDVLRRPFVTTPGGRIDLAHAPFDASAAANLHRALIAPLDSLLRGVKSVAIAPDATLWYVPFAALVTGRASGRASYLVEQYELRLVPSAQFIGARGSGLPKGFRVEALTYSAPGGEAELAVVRSALGAGRVLVREGEAATERAALKARSNVLHLAVHGAVDDRDPLASHLRLASSTGDDGLLHLSEIASRRVGPQLVVLTACEAVSGKLYAGEGLVGLARAFLVSGARHVIASEWPVAASAADLSGVLYRELAAGQSPAAALRSAQLALLKSPANAHPIHWAGFVAFDGPRNR